MFSARRLFVYGLRIDLDRVPYLELYFWISAIMQFSVESKTYY